jgi:hypothetical protein
MVQLPMKASLRMRLQCCHSGGMFITYAEVFAFLISVGVRAGTVPV